MTLLALRFFVFVLRCRSALEDIIEPFYGDDVPRQHGGAWRQSFEALERRSVFFGLLCCCDDCRRGGFTRAGANILAGQPKAVCRARDVELAGSPAKS